MLSDIEVRHEKNAKSLIVNVVSNDGKRPSDFKRDNKNMHALSNLWKEMSWGLEPLQPIECGKISTEQCEEKDHSEPIGERCVGRRFQGFSLVRTSTPGIPTTCLRRPSIYKEVPN